jgi:hypothetical protein
VGWSKIFGRVSPLFFPFIHFFPFSFSPLFHLRRMLRRLIFNQLRTRSCTVSGISFPAYTSGRSVRSFTELSSSAASVAGLDTLQSSTHVSSVQPATGLIYDKPSLKYLRGLVSSRDWKYFAKKFYQYSQEMKKKNQFPSVTERTEILNLVKAARNDRRMKRGDLINVFRSLYELGFSSQNVEIKAIRKCCLQIRNKEDRLLESDCILFFNALRKFGFVWKELKEDEVEKGRILSLFSFVNAQVISEIQYKELVVGIDTIKIPWNELPLPFINNLFSDVISAKHQYNRMSSRLFLHAFIEAMKIRRMKHPISTEENEAILQTIAKMSKDILDYSPSGPNDHDAWTREV